MTTKQSPIELPETIDTSEKIETHFVFLSHEADDPAVGVLHLIQSFAHFDTEGGVDIISSDINYYTDVAGIDSEEAEHKYQHISLNHSEMTKLAKAWLEWSEETPDLA